MEVSQDDGTPKWMVYFMENPIKLYGFKMANINDG